MIVVDRDDFIAWSQGILLDRKSDGSTTVGDRSIHEKAKDAMDKGEIIALTMAGRIVSYMKVEEESYEEFIPETD